MLKKLTGLARILAVLLAIVAGVVTIPGLDVTTALIVLGLIAGLTTKREDPVNLMILVIALPIVAMVLGGLPDLGASLGARLGGIFGNFGTAVAGHAAMGFAIAIYNTVMGDVKGLGGSSS